MNCDYCGAPLVEPLLWHGRLFPMEDKDGIPIRHLCPTPELPPPNEKWWRKNKAPVEKVTTVPEQKESVKPPERAQPAPIAKASASSRKPKTVDLDA